MLISSYFADPEASSLPLYLDVSTSAMRLINVPTMELEDIIGDDVPEYLILPHTWGSEEVSFQAFQSTGRDTLGGWQKIQEFCKIARGVEIDYAWVDTCCIDKSSSAELSEAINSMFR